MTNFQAQKVRNPEKIQNFVKKKSHGHNNALNQKSLCAKLLLHTKMNYTQGFCLIFNCFRVSFFFDSKFCLNMAKIAIISQGVSIVKISNMHFCIDCDNFMLPTHRRSQKHIVHMNLLVSHFHQICPQNCSLSLKCVLEPLWSRTGNQLPTN